MFPAKYEQFNDFINSNVCDYVFLEIYDDTTLISVAVTDVFHNALSAVYTFYHPDYRKNSIGMYSILEQIKLANHWQKTCFFLAIKSTIVKNELQNKVLSS